MNKSLYKQVRRSIRDNGLVYTVRHAMDVHDTDTLLVCDEIVNIMKETDWLVMRAMFARNSDKAVAFKLTTPLLANFGE